MQDVAVQAVLDRAAAFLHRMGGLRFCEVCLRAEVGLTPAQITAVFAELPLRRGFRQAARLCSRCGAGRPVLLAQPDTPPLAAGF